MDNRQYEGLLHAINRLTSTVAAVGVVLLYKDSPNSTYSDRELRTMRNAQDTLERESCRG